MRPLASLSLDLDNKWSYLKTHGNERWRDFPSYFDLVVPRVLQVLDHHNLKISFFIVGQDAALEKNKEALTSLVAAGHELGNHSFHHEPWLHLYSDEEIHDELRKAHDAITAATGCAPSGFRGPGFSLSQGTLNAVQSLGYRYDATSFPNILNPLARAYFFMKSDLSAEEREKRKALFGTVWDAFKPVGPYRWQTDGGTLLELPVTTLPLFRIPFHLSYVLYLASYSPSIARLYFKSALTLCRMTGTEPSVLLHPLDFMGKEDDDDLSFFPGMNMPNTTKLELVEELLTMLTQHHDVVTMGQHVDRIEGLQLPEMKPLFRH